MATKDIAYYLEHPEEVDPENKELIDQILNSDVGKATADVPAEEPKAEEPEAAAAEVVEPEEVKEEVKEPEPEAKAAEPEPKGGVLAPDGKSIIPYGVLQEARRQNSALKERLAELEAARAKPEGEAQAEEDDGIGESEAKVRKSLDAIREEAPWLAEPLAEALDPLLKATKTLQERVGKVAATVEEERHAGQREAASETQRIIDSIPELAAWQAEGGRAWERAVQFDNLLKGDPDWQDKPMSERFARVVELSQAVNPVRTSTKPESKPDPAAVKKAAESKLQSAEPQITTLTDLPGGAPPAQSENQKVDDMSTQQLGAMFSKMTPDQMAAYLAKLGA